MLRFASTGDGAQVSAADVAELLVREAGGGIMLGLLTGYVAYRAMRLIDDYAIEVLISLALVTGTYALALHLHVSGPLSMVAAGLLIGDRGPRYAMSERTQGYLFALWTLIDEILNSVLFLLIGLETLILRFDPRSLRPGSSDNSTRSLRPVCFCFSSTVSVRMDSAAFLAQRALSHLGGRSRRNFSCTRPVHAG